MSERKRKSNVRRPGDQNAFCVQKIQKIIGPARNHMPVRYWKDTDQIQLRWKWSTIPSANAVDIHRRCAKVGHDIDTCNAGCSSRCSMRPRDAGYSTDFAIAFALAEIRKGKSSIRRGWHH